MTCLKKLIFDMENIASRTSEILRKKLINYSLLLYNKYQSYILSIYRNRPDQQRKIVFSYKGVIQVNETKILYKERIFRISIDY